MKLVLATRASRLALWQAEEARLALGTAWGDLVLELLPLTSAGDADLETDLARFGQIGIFSAAVDRAVLDGRARVGVHSLKDLTSELTPGIVLAGVLPRGPVEDAWVQPDGVPLEDLPRGASVATGSRRRGAMLRAVRPDLELVGMRGNVETRLAKLRAGEADAMLLARAGLVRLGLEDAIAEVLDVERFLPAAGQGTVGLTCRADDEEAARRLAGVSDPEAWHEGLAERAVLAGLRGGCSVPLGVHARVVESTLAVRARVLAVDGSEAIDGTITGPRDDAAGLGRTLAQTLLGRGAERLLEAARA